MKPDTKKTLGFVPGLVSETPDPKKIALQMEIDSLKSQIAGYDAQIDTILNDRKNANKYESLDTVRKKKSAAETKLATKNNELYQLQ